MTHTCMYMVHVHVYKHGRKLIPYIALSFQKLYPSAENVPLVQRIIIHDSVFWEGQWIG